MAIPIVPNLQTFSFIIPDGQILTLGESRHRTYIQIALAAEKIADKLYLWVGSAPEPDIAYWVELGGDLGVGIKFDYGVFGPIYMAQGGIGEGRVIIISNLDETLTASLTPVVLNTVVIHGQSGDTP
jgi:hypothetical protein